jgi:hypothetical protein
MTCSCNDKKPIYKNTSPILYVECKDPVTDALFDPATLSVLITKPDTSTVTISYPGSGWYNPSTGKYELVYNVSASGWYKVRVTVSRTNGASAADETEFEVID